MTRELTTLFYEVFAARPFGGNVAGIVLDADDLAAEEMLAIAAELNLATTGFVTTPRGADRRTVGIRYFTPQREIDLCGYVAVAAATALVEENRIAPGHSEQIASGGSLDIQTTTTTDGLAVEMGQHLPTFEGFEPPIGELEDVLGIDPADAGESARQCEIAGTGLRHLIVPFASTDALSRLRPNFSLVAHLSRRLHVDTVCAFAPRASAAPGHEMDVQMRDFCAGIGADEEAASGTTSGALACYLAKHNHVAVPRDGQATITVHQGVEMHRPSRIIARLEYLAGQLTTVSVRGSARRVLTGYFHL